MLSWVGIVGACALGIAILESVNTEKNNESHESDSKPSQGISNQDGITRGEESYNLSEWQKTRSELKYDKEYCRENLSGAYYDNWDIDTVVYALKDRWVKDDVERMMRNGYSFERAIDELVREGRINL